MGFLKVQKIILTKMQKIFYKSVEIFYKVQKFFTKCRIIFLEIFYLFVIFLQFIFLHFKISTVFFSTLWTPSKKKNMSDHPPQVRDKYGGGQSQVYLEIAQVDYHANMEVLARKLIDLQLIYYHLISKKRDTGRVDILHNQVRGEGGKGGSQILMFIAATDCP